MSDFKFALGHIAYKTITGFFDAAFLPSGLRGGISLKENNAPADFTPVLRFAVCSDIHLNGEENQPAAERLGRLFDDTYNYAETQNYKNLDAVLVAGDFATSGETAEYELFNKVVSGHCKSGTQVLTVLGNHEFIWCRKYDASLTYKRYKEVMQRDTDFHTVINGFHFIGVSYCEDGKTFTGKKDLLKAELDKAVAENPSKPVFVMQHPSPTATIYGSVNWGDITIRKVLSKYPQVVDFSGHSHYASADPRSIWQGSFTAIGCGSLSAYMGNLNYIEGDKDAPGESGGFRIAEVDKSGNILLKLYDVVNRTFFTDSEYYLTNVTSKSSRKYSWLNNHLRDEKPVFEKDTITAERNENGEVILSFPDAYGYYEAESYIINIKSGNKTVLNKTVLSDYVRANRTGMKTNLGELEKGTYEVKITPVSPFAKKGVKITGRVEIL